MKKWFAITLIVLTGCSPKVVSYLNPKAKFKTYETYRLVSAKLDSKNVTPENTLVFDHIKENIHSQMKTRGYQLSNVTPDLTLRYEVTSSTRVENNTSQNNFYSYPGYQITTRTIYESVLMVELLDTNNKLVWQGSYDLRQQRKEKKVPAAIEKAVGYIFTTYPYEALLNSPNEELRTLESKKKDTTEE
ncbi:MAG: DUF4136 domain-containing protein [Ekhidna sp.]|uniref:DUF4136 domain-containing protein n=1 Tax=Ekhidna sp. TaxID=2608089 RepID=UPI0032EE7D41